MYDSRRSADHTPINSASQVPEIQQSMSRQDVNESIMQFIKTNTTNPARWASTDDDSSEPRIVPDPLKLILENGLIKSDEIMRPLTVDLDPHAWELDPGHLEFQELIGNIRK